MWRGEFAIPTGNWQYKAALNDNWTVSYPPNNKPLNLTAGQPVRFYYDNKTTSVLDNVNDKIAVVAGTLQSQLGCSGDWQPSCVATLMTDPNGDGIYTFVTTGLMAGSYQFKVALNETWDLYLSASNVSFTVATNNEQVTISWNSSTNAVNVQVGAQAGDLSKAQAVWVTRGYASLENRWYPLQYLQPLLRSYGYPAIDPDRYCRWSIRIQLTYDPAGLSAQLLARYPNLAGYNALHLAPSDLWKDAGILKARPPSRQLIPPVPYLMLRRSRPTVSWTIYIPSTGRWASSSITPCRRSGCGHLQRARSSCISLTVQPRPSAPQIAMTNDPISGVLGATGTARWTNKYYLYEVEVYVRKQGNTSTTS